MGTCFTLTRCKIVISGQGSRVLSGFAGCGTTEATLLPEQWLRGLWHNRSHVIARAATYVNSVPVYFYLTTFLTVLWLYSYSTDIEAGPDVRFLLLRHTVGKLRPCLRCLFGQKRLCYIALSSNFLLLKGKDHSLHVALKGVEI